MSEHTGCFSPYMLISSTLQAVFGFDKRSQQEQQVELMKQHQLELIKMKEEFQDNLEKQKVADMRAKMAIARRYRSEEKFAQTELQYKTEELRLFFVRYLPIMPQSIPLLITEASHYREKGYDASCPLNVILLHTRHDDLDYEEIYDELEKAAPTINNIVFQRWCNRDAAHNSAILNLHAIMWNIPTLVISPYYQAGEIHFTVSIWEAQSQAKPMIRPLFSISCNKKEYLNGKTFSVLGKKYIQERITLISIIISGCARDSYMLMTQGLPPTFPSYLQKNPNVLNAIVQPENKELFQFVISEYKAAQLLLANAECESRLLTKDQMILLSNEAKEAEKKMMELSKNFIEKK